MQNISDKQSHLNSQTLQMLSTVFIWTLVGCGRPEGGDLVFVEKQRLELFPEPSMYESWRARDGVHRVQIQSQSFNVVLADLDGDGDLDAWNTTALYEQIWLNRGDGSFARGARLEGKHDLGGFFEQSVRRAAIGDIDGDGDLDAIPPLGNVWLNNGDGTFLEGPLNFRLENPRVKGDHFDELMEKYGTSPGYFARRSWEAALADLDGDSDLDVLTLCGLVWINDGLGNFTLQGDRIAGDIGLRSCFSLGDIDGDNDLDAFVVSHFKNRSQIWLNDGKGHFIPDGRTAEIKGFFGVTSTLVDIDGDGDLDAWVDDQFWLNDGSGGYSLGGRIAWQRGNDDLSSFVRELTGNYVNRDTRKAQMVACDLDNDADMDVLTYGNHYPYKAWQNKGEGKFVKWIPKRGNEHIVGTAMAVGDLDGDGDMDLFCAGNPNIVLHQE